mmetsp:Transcript_15545/g.63365  ORF Transcript_15545/g.63365 Transcript_15545/m.63365 type:complete len:89 (+) Transcript_15545:2219-2485(+)
MLVNLVHQASEVATSIGELHPFLNALRAEDNNEMKPKSYLSSNRRPQKEETRPYPQPNNKKPNSIPPPASLENEQTQNLVLATMDFFF